MKSRKKMTVNQMVLIALAACINTAGGQAALALSLIHIFLSRSIAQGKG